MSHIPRSSRTLTSLNNTCPCACVFERKKKLCVCVCPCVCVVSTLSSWEAFLGVYCLHTFAYVRVLQCALIRCQHGYHPLASLEAGGRWIQRCSSFWCCTWKQPILYLWRCAYSMLYFCSFLLTPQHRSHSVWIHLACNLYAYPGWKNQEFVLAHVELPPCFLAYLAFQQRIMTVGI